MSDTGDRSEVSIRRAPRLGVFLVIGALVGGIGTLVLTSLQPADPNVGFVATFAYLLLYGIPAGVVLGALAGLVLDASSRRRARTVTVEHQAVDATGPRVDTTGPRAG